MDSCTLIAAATILIGCHAPCHSDDQQHEICSDPAPCPNARIPARYACIRADGSKYEWSKPEPPERKLGPIIPPRP